MMRTIPPRIDPGYCLRFKAGFSPAFLWVLFLGLVVSGCASQPFRTVSSATLQVAPAVTLAGALDRQALPLLARTDPLIIDLRTAEEADVAADRQRLRDAGVQVVDLPIGREPLLFSTVRQFERLLESRGNRPVIVHCASGNRAGMLWAAHLLAQGSAIDVAQAAVALVVTKDEARAAISTFAEGLADPR